MPGKHKHPPVGFRPPEALRGRLLAYAAETGSPVGTIITAALEAYLPGATAPVLPPEVKPARCRQRPRQPGPVAAELARERAQDKRASDGGPTAAACKHTRALKGWCSECKTGGH